MAGTDSGIDGVVELIARPGHTPISLRQEPGRGYHKAMSQNPDDARRRPHKRTIPLPFPGRQFGMGGGGEGCQRGMAYL